MSDSATSGRSEKEIFFEALDKPTPQERAAFLDGACGANRVQRAKMEALLADHFQQDSFMKEPAVEACTPTLPSVPPSEAPAQMLGRYKLLEKIGEGGFGEVWMAEQREPIKRRVALKIIKLGMDSRQIVNRFAAERQALAMMDHANIAKIFDADVTEAGRPYFVMELVRGIKITEYCDQNQLPTHERLRLFILVCQAIQHAHQKGIIHRDIKPSNILVTLHDGTPVPKVIDFGIAKATQQELTDKTVFTQFQQFVGTPAYISPEQAEMSGLDIDTRADIYSLGVLLYELLVSQTPFDAKEMMQGGIDALRQIIREREPLRPSTKLNTLAGEARTTAGKRRQTDVGKLVHELQGDLDWIVMKCLEKDRSRRYDTANGLATDLKRHLNNEPVIARPSSAAYKLQKAWRRNKLAFSAAATVLCVLILGVVVSTWQAVRATRAEREQSRLRQDAESHAQSESHLRRLAKEAQTAEAAQRQRAERSGAESRDRLVRLNVANGARLLEEGDYFGSLVWFAEALDLEQGNSDKVAIHRLRIESVIQHCPRLLHCWFHSGRVNAASFSKDGRRVVTASDDQTARVWDVATGEAVTPALPHVGHVTDALFSPDGSRVLTAAQDGARLWDADSGEIRVKLDTNATISGIFSPDGSLVATMGGNATVRVWDSTTGRLVGLPFQHRRELSSMVFHPDGTRLATASYDGAARVWNVRSGELMFTLPHNHAVRWVAISPDGKLIATANWRNSAHLWDAATGKPVVSSLPHEQWVSHVAFSPDSKSMVSSSGDGKARIWNTQNGELLRTISHGKGLIMQSEFSPDGKGLVLRHFDGRVEIYSASEGGPIAPAIKQSWWATVVDFHPDNRRLLTAGADGTVRLWDLNPEDAVVWPWAQASVAIMGWSPERGKVVTENADGLWQVWDTKTGQSNSIAFSFTNEVMAAALSRDEQRWLSMERHFSPSTAMRATVTVKTWSLKSGAMENHTEVRLSETLPAPNSLSASPDCDHLILSDGIGAEAWDLARDRFLWRFAPENADFKSGAIFSPDGKSCALQCKRHVHILDVATGRERFSPLTNKLAVTSAAFSPDSRRLVSTCSDDSYENGEARIWDMGTGHLLLALPHIDGVECASFSPDGRMLATGGEAKVGRVFDVATGLPISPILRHEERIFNVAFSHNGQLLATATRGRHAVRLWDISTGEPVTPPLPLLNTVDSMFFLPGDRTLVTEVAGIFRSWNVRYGQRPSSDVAMSARLQASQQLDSTGVPSALGLTELSNFWNHLSHLYPKDFQFEEKKAMPTRQPRQLRPSVPIPPRAAMASSNLVDLTAFYGAGLNEPWANDLSLLPAGLQAFAGVTFDVRGVIQLYGDSRNVRRFPTRVEAIPIGLRCRRLRFLHAAQWQAAPGQIVGWYVIRYADGTAQEWPLVYGTNVRDWWKKSSPPSLSHAEVAWAGTTRKGEPIALDLATWENPQASLEIATVDFISARTPCAPFLIALTAE